MLPLLAFTLLAGPAEKPAPVAEAAGRMTVPPGFTVTLFAGEPDIVQPIAFTFDDRGRMWVVECVTYPKWLLPGQKGKDRVVILEDTDGDGKHDKKTVVLDDGFNLSGIELGFGGMYLCSTPNLVFVPIRDDKPSGPPQVLLDGWNLKDAKHNVFNSLMWGPDGWLYGCNGIQTKSYVGAPGTPQDKRTYFDAGVWRFHPTKKVFDVVATGTTNPWGLDWDDRGEMFITNCVIDHLWHVVPGGRYTRMYGQDPDPYAFGLLGSCVDYKHWAGGHWTDSRFDKATGTAKKEHGDAGGGHAHSGAAIYLGDNFPPQYRNTLFTCNIHGNRLNNDGLVRTPGGMKGVRRPDFLFANDPWFRGICVKQGPDGALYASDWSDTGECHNYDVADIRNGRIYRVAYGSPKKFAADVSTMGGGELAAAQKSPNEWLVRRARLEIQERAHRREAVPSGPLGDLLKDPTASDAQRLRGLWALCANGGIKAEDYLHVVQSSAPPVAAWGFRLAFDQGPNGYVIPHLLRRFGTAATDAEKRELLTAAGLAARYHAAELLPAVRAVNSDDPQLQLFAWQTAAKLLAAANVNDPDPRLFAAAAARESAVRYSVARDAKAGLAVALRALADARATRDFRVPILAGLSEALAGRKFDAPPEGWKSAYDSLVESGETETTVRAHALGLQFNDPQAVVLLAFQATHHKAPADRIKAVELLAPLKKSELQFGDVLRKMLADADVRGAAVRGLAHYPEPETAPAILAAYGQFTAAEKADAVLTLASRPAFALALLDAVEKGAVPKGDITAFAARQILALNNKPAAEKLAAVWGTVKPAAANRAAQTARLKKFLTPDSIRAGDLARGRAVYDRSCAACHKLFGEGGAVGPELTGSQRANLDYILENVLDPNAVVANEYKMTAFALADGRTVTGIVRKETPTAVVVRTANEELTLAKADIESRKATQNSVMPEGQFDTLKDDEIRDLIAYLAAKDQVKPK